MTILKCKRIYFEDGCKDGYLTIQDGKITGFLTRVPEELETIDYSDRMIIPGMINTHIHGTHGYEFDGEDSVPFDLAVKRFVKGCAANGATAVLLTVGHIIGHRMVDDKMVFPMDRVKNMYKAIVDEIEKDAVNGGRIMGIQSEGPFMARSAFGQKPMPVNIEIIQELIECTKGHIRVMAISPELENTKELVELLHKHNIKIALCHTNMDEDDAQKAITEYGITIATHIGNNMKGIHHRNVGPFGVCLLRDDVVAELIGDVFILSDDGTRLVLRCKGIDNIMLISDGGLFIGFDPGVYKVDNFQQSDRAIITERGIQDGNGGFSACKTVLQCVKAMIRHVGCSMEDCLKMAALNPARVYGFDDRKGSIQMGKDADMVVIDDDFNVIATYVEGRKVYDCNIEEDIWNTAFLEKLEKLSD